MNEQINKHKKGKRTVILTGTVSVGSNDPPCQKCPIYNGTLKTFKYSFNIEIGVCKHIEPHLYSAAISSVSYVHNELNTAHRVNWS